MIKQKITRLAWVLFFAIGAAQATPDIQHWNTSNQAQVFFVEAPELPMVDIRIIFNAASAHDGDKPGTALLTNGLLNEGTPQMNADQIAERFESLGAEFGSASLKDMAVVSLRSLTQKELLDPAVDTLAALLSQPTFPKENLERERKRLLTSLQAKKQSPGAIASEMFFKGIYQDHPYAAESSGTEASVKAIKRSDLVAFHQRYYVGSNATVAIVGAVSKKQAQALAEKVIGSLPQGKPAAAIAKVKPLTQGRTLTTFFPSSQTHILVGQPGMTRDDPDYFPLYVGNHILGGSGLVSRLSEEVREKRGLSYSAYSYFSPMRQQGPFQMGLQTRNDQADEALKVMMETLQTFIKEGPQATELEAAKQNLTGGFALRLDSNKKIIEYVAMIGFYDLPLDYLNTLLSRIESVTTEQIQEAFSRRITPDRMVTVMVGGEVEKAEKAP
ncbi:MAG TPA: insulinase family protein [Candidatus Tenderia sp.]|nr:insulinase family protein [Candidatus Tenderia sp.]